MGGKARRLAAFRRMPFTPLLAPGWRPRLRLGLWASWQWSGLMTILSALTWLGKTVSRTCGW